MKTLVRLLAAATVSAAAPYVAELSRPLALAACVVLGLCVVIGAARK